MTDTVMTCLFRSCEWQSEDVTGAPVRVRDKILAKHLLADHEQAVRVIGLLAEEADLT